MCASARQRLLLPALGFLLQAVLLTMATFCLSAQTSSGRPGATTNDSKSFWAEASVSGQVTDRSGKPLPRTQVRLTRQPDGTELTGAVDEDGAFRFDRVAPGTYVLSATGDGFAPTSESFTLAAGDTRRATLPLAVATLAQQVTVTATRSIESTAAIPGSVTVVNREQIDEQSALSRTLPGVLGKLVPGMGAPSESQTIFGQTLRGRNYAVLIDGVPQSTSRNVARDLGTIDPAIVERVEVIRGATAIYGDRAAGGVINIITRAPGEGRPRFTTDLGLDTSLVHPSGSLGGVIRQTATGRKNWFDYSLAGAFTRTGSFFDAEGDRIPADPFGQGGLADLESYDVFSKLGATFGRQRLQGTLNYLHAGQDTEWASDPLVNRLAPGTQKSRAIRGLDMDHPQGTRNTVASLDYNHQRLFGSRVHGQFYHRDYLTYFGPFDGRGIAIWGNQIRQSYLDSRRTGGRFEVETPLFEKATLLWGSDYSREHTLQPVNNVDPVLYDQSRGLVIRKIGEAAWVPPVNQRNLGLFGQFEWKATERWLLRTGLRHERIRAAVDDFTTLAGNRLTGGRLRYSDTLYNAGAVFTATSWLNVFGNFSQGFSAPDIGLALRGAPAGSTLQSLPYQAQKVNAYEAGIRTLWSRVQTSLSAHYNSSDLGTSSGGFNQPVVRAPERVYGAEATVDVQASARWRAGGTGTWLEGKSDPRFRGVYTYLNSFRIPPLKLTGYIEHDTTRRWRNRLQVLYSGSRKRFPGSTVFGERDVLSYTLVDWISSVRVGPGSLRMGVENLLNRMYFTRESQLLWSGRNDSFSAARGATASIGYAFTY